MRDGEGLSYSWRSPPTPISHVAMFAGINPQTASVTISRLVAILILWRVGVDLFVFIALLNSPALDDGFFNLWMPLILAPYSAPVRLASMKASRSGRR